MFTFLVYKSLTSLGEKMNFQFGSGQWKYIAVGVPKTAYRPVKTSYTPQNLIKDLNDPRKFGRKNYALPVNSVVKIMYLPKKREI